MNIRRTNTEFQRQFAESDHALLCLIRDYLGDYDIVLRSKAKPDCDFLAQLFFDRWTARYLEFIKDDEMGPEEHFHLLRGDAAAMVDLLFDDRFARCAVLKTMEPTE